jgi:hypothetical protein
LWFDNVFSCSWSSYRRFRWTSCWRWGQHIIL